MKLKLISCEVFYREMHEAISKSVHKVEIEFLPKGLHNLEAASMLRFIQNAVDRADDDRFKAILIGYGMCNNGLAGLKARSVPLVIPRAHDCITVFMGNAQRYQKYFEEHPGVYFKTTGWMERTEDSADLNQLAIPTKNRMELSYEEMVEKYGEENARFLQEQLGHHTRNYKQITFIEMGVEPDSSFEQKAKDQAQERGWKFEKIAGDLAIFHRFLNGPWGEEFLIVQPGQQIAADYSGKIMKAEKCHHCHCSHSNGTEPCQKGAKASV